MSIRIVKIRGREYAQEVKYIWDPIKKVGKTIVLRHIGPVKPLNPQRYIPTKIITTHTTKRVKKMREKNVQFHVNKKLHIRKNKTELLPLTPPPDLLAQVLKLVKDSNRNLSRKEVYDLFLLIYKRNPDDPQTLKMRIGFALTILEREGKIE